MAAQQALVTANKAARTSISTEEHQDHVPKSLSIAIVATLDPVRTTIRDLFSRMHFNKLGIMRGAKPMLTNMVNQRSGKVEYDVEHGKELSSFFLTGLAVQLPRCKLTDGPNSPWRFKKTATQNNTLPIVGLVLENCPEEDLRYDRKMRCNFILKELEDLDPDHRFDRAAAEQFFKIVDDMVLEKASGLCTQMIQNYDDDCTIAHQNAREGEPEDKAHVKGTEVYHVGLKDFIKRKRNGDYLLHDCMCTIHLDCNDDTFMWLISHCI